MRLNKGFTLIELLVVVALVGILSAIGVYAFTGFISSTKQKQAETTMNTIYLAEMEYKSNNNVYYFSSNKNAIVRELFDGVDEFQDQEYQYSIRSISDGFCIRASKSGARTLYLNHQKKKTNC